MNKKCQVFTPDNIAFQMLDLANYNTNLFGKRVLENSCGKGNLLIHIVRRYIEDCIKNNIDIDLIKKGLEQDIWGFDIDSLCYEECINRLNALSSNFNIYDVNWRIEKCDSLMSCPIVKFDYIFGNPPYITYREISVGTRENLRKIYNSCSVGAFDYCYAFIEHGISCLADNGILSYLVPSSIFKNVHADELRKLLLPYLTRINDYTTQKLFGPSVLTSSALLICKKSNSEVTSMIYKNIVDNTEFNIDKTLLQNGKWQFIPKKNISNRNNSKFSDYFSTSIVIATLLNEAFVIKNPVEVEDGIVANDNKIEKAAVREAVSPRSLKYDRKEYIIFPYHNNDGIKRYTEDAFENLFPNARAYLYQYYEKLMKRDVDKGVKWFEYGRSQALSSICQEKLLISTVVTNKVEVYKLSANCIPYSGIFIKQKGEVPLEVAIKILQSNEFYEYVKGIGIYANGKSIRITAADIGKFEFISEDYINGTT